MKAGLVRKSLVELTAVALAFGFPSLSWAQQLPPACDPNINADCTPFGRGGGFGTPMMQSRQGAPVDLSGYWVSVVTEDWRWRMVTPPKGDYASIPLSAEGVRVADMWDPESDADTCKHFGAAGLMRNPMRLRISWDDDTVLRIETDHGTQTRLLHFEAPASHGGPPSLQGDSIAQWHETGLEVITTNLSPGYLRKNGVPYSSDTLLTEYYDRFEAYGDEWLLVTTVVSDPIYLTREFLTSTQFKRLPDAASWNPVPCGQD